MDTITISHFLGVPLEKTTEQTLHSLIASGTGAVARDKQAHKEALCEAKIFGHQAHVKVTTIFGSEFWIVDCIPRSRDEGNFWRVKNIYGKLPDGFWEKNIDLPRTKAPLLKARGGSFSSYFFKSFRVSGQEQR